MQSSKISFVCSNKSYCKHGNIHNEKGRDCGRPSNSLERLRHQMGTLHTSRNATIVNTSNIATTPSTLHPHV